MSAVQLPFVENVNHLKRAHGIPYSLCWAYFELRPGYVVVLHENPPNELAHLVS